MGGLGLLLDRVSSSLVKEFEETISEFGLRNIHLGVLSTVARFGPLPQARIAEYLGIERQTMANLIDDLERRDAVERTRIPEDRRVWAIELTRSGRELQKRASRAGARYGRVAFANLDADEREQLARLLVKVAAAGRYPRLFVPPGEAGG